MFKHQNELLLSQYQHRPWTNGCPIAACIGVWVRDVKIAPFCGYSSLPSPPFYQPQSHIGCRHIFLVDWEKYMWCRTRYRWHWCVFFAPLSVIVASVPFRDAKKTIILKIYFYSLSLKSPFKRRITTMMYGKNCQKPLLTVRMKWPGGFQGCWFHFWWSGRSTLAGFWDRFLTQKTLEIRYFYQSRVRSYVLLPSK